MRGSSASAEWLRSTGTHRNGHRVAIKILHPWAAADATIVERFAREGYIANAIEHPGAVRVIDDDTTEDGTVFLVMELLQGRPLSSLADEHPQSFPLDAALDAADQLLDVLAAAHARQIVHRDLKPDNVFVTTDGLVKLLDLGVARMRGITGRSHATRTGALMGTPGFMPPEQVLGEQEKIDARSDLWAVGATLYNLFTGRVVHESHTPEQTMLRAATMPVKPLVSAAPRVPAEIAHVVDRALAIQRDDRYPDARAMQSALRDARTACRLGLAVEPPRAALARMVQERSDAPATTTSKLASAVAISTPPRRATKSRAPGIVAVALAATVVASAYLLQTRSASFHRHAVVAAPLAPTATDIPLAAPPPPPAPLPGAKARSEGPAAGVVASAAPSSVAASPARRGRGALKPPSPATSVGARAPVVAPPAAVGDPFDRP